MKKFKIGKVILSTLLSVLCFMLGAQSGVMMAAASELPDAGVTASGNPGDAGGAGIATESEGRGWRS